MSAQDQPTLADDAPRCPQCGYIMLGLSVPRCPECAATFTWEAARRAGSGPRIAFERCTGAGRLRGLLETWVQVVFVPWVFARQAVGGFGLRHAVVFLAICLLGPAIGCIRAPWQMNLAWGLTALLYIAIQTPLLAALERFPGGLDAVERDHLPMPSGLRFWLGISCYTSAVMLTEWYYGPPPLLLRDLAGVLWKSQRTLVFSELFSWQLAAIVCWTQLAVWCLAMGCVFAARIRGPRMPERRRLLLSCAIGLLSLVLYAAVVEHIGMNLYRWLDELF